MKTLLITSITDEDSFYLNKSYKVFGIVFSYLSKNEINLKYLNIFVRAIVKNIYILYATIGMKIFSEYHFDVSSFFIEEEVKFLETQFI
jgi:hypothetical protein